MSYRVWGERWLTADFTPPYRVYQPITPNQNIKLKAIRTSLIIFNNPTFTSVAMRIYSSRAGVPGVLIATSSPLLKSEIHTLANGVKECGWEFENTVSMEADTEYVIVPVFAGYTGDVTSECAWKRAFPSKLYDQSEAMTYVNLLKRPFEIMLIGEKI